MSKFVVGLGFFAIVMALVALVTTNRDTGPEPDGQSILLPITKHEISLEELRKRYYESGYTAEDRAIQQGWIRSEEIAVIDKGGSLNDRHNFRLHNQGLRITDRSVGPCAVRVSYDAFGVSIKFPKNVKTCQFGAFYHGFDWVTPSSVLSEK